MAVPEIVIQAEELFRLGSFPVTNTLLLSLLTFGTLTATGVAFSRRIKTIPGSFQNFIEFAFESMLNFINTILHNRAKTEKYFPIIATVFFFILVSNWLGLLPGVGSIVYHGLHEGKAADIPFLRSPASDLNFTIALALISVISVNILGVAAIGFAKHFKKFFNFSGPIVFFVGILEFISEIAKIISFSFRLFGNVFAGEVLLTIVVFLVPYFVPVPFFMLEVFVGFIQALVFAVLTTVFIGMATIEHH
jgi:F-type H+-transporting ATPase subunit a